MVTAVGYKQTLEHINESPVIKTKINKLSSLGTCKYYPGAPKTANKEEVLKRPDKYNFDVIVKAEDAPTSFRHSCFFDKEDDAKKAYHKLKLQWYDQQTVPILKKINAGKKVSIDDKTLLIELFKSIDEKTF